MKLRKVNYYPQPQNYPSKGNAHVPIGTHAWDEAGYYLSVSITGRSHPDTMSDAGIYHIITT